MSELETKTTQTTEPTGNESQEHQQQQTQKDTGQETEPELGSSLLNEEEEGESKATEGEKKPESKAAAPEKYEPFKVPDSWAEKGLELDPATMEKFGPLAKDLGLTQEQAQRLVDFYIGVAEGYTDGAVKQVMDLRKSWRDEVAADRNVGHRLTEVKANFAKMLSSLGDQNLVAAFKEAMDLTGAGDHPAFIRAADLWSKRFIEGTLVLGNGPSTEGQKQPGARPESAARALYPNNP